MKLSFTFMTNDISTKSEAKNPQDSDILYSPSANVYENTVLIAKRSKQILSGMRFSFLAELEELEDMEGYIENSRNSRKQQQLSKKYEKMPKPVVIAIKDATEGSLMYSYPDKN